MTASGFSVATRHTPILAGLLVLSALSLGGSCRRPAPTPSGVESKASDLVRVGSLAIRQEDLDHLLAEKHGGRSDEQTRQQALEELVSRARYAQAALDAGLADDPVVRAEVARLLERRFREQQLAPRIGALAGIPEARLRERYEAERARFQTPEKREVAVLWLDPGRDPARDKAYVEKLTQARAWLFDEGDQESHPESGFGVLSLDYSEHAASRFKGGVVGWLERDGGLDAWRQAVAEIAFSLEGVGAVSDVVIRPEGIFLVRLMALRAAVLVPFEAVEKRLEQEERSRLRLELESRFERDIASRYEAENR